MSENNKFVDVEWQYDTDHAKEFKKAKEADELLANVGVKGAKQPTKKEVKKAEETVQNYKRDKAKYFLDEYEKLTEYCGIEIDLTGFEMVMPRTYQPKLGIQSKKPKQETKPWHEALAENLQKRKECQHEEDDNGICKKCGLGVKHWGTGGMGVTKEYEDTQNVKIEEAKKEDKEGNVVE